MKRLRIRMHLVIVAVALVVTGSVALGQNQPSGQPNLDSRTARILSEMGAYLSSAGEFAFQAQLNYDAVKADGQKILFGARNRVWVRRPDRMLADYDGDERRSRVLFNGRTITVYDLERNVYAVTEVPAGLDNALDFVFERYGFSVPIVDFVYENPDQVLLESVEKGYYVGRHPVDGVPCHHLAFTQEEIDWQIWIEDGPQPVPRKLVITFKSQPGSPQYNARIHDWDFSPRLSERFFEFHPPADAGEIEFLSVQPVEEK